jgi:hypothetical protein
MRILSVFVVAVLIGCSTDDGEVVKLNQEIASLQSQLADCKLTTQKLVEPEMVQDSAAVENQSASDAGDDIPNTQITTNDGGGSSNDNSNEGSVEIFGSGDSGNGNGSGAGDSGSGNGNGSATDPNTIKRFMVTKPDFTGLSANKDAEVKLKLSVDAKGNVVFVESLSKVSATVNQVLINNVKSIVKSEAKYNRVKGADLTKLKFTAIISAP